MALKLDPKAVTDFELDGITYQIRTFTSRERMRVGAYWEPLAEAFTNAEGLTVTMTAELIDAMEGILCLGLVGWSLTDTNGNGKPAPVPFPFTKLGYMDPHGMERIPEKHWNALFNRIIEENSVSEEDRKNSQSS